MNIKLVVCSYIILFSVGCFSSEKKSHTSQIQTPILDDNTVRGTKPEQIKVDIPVVLVSSTINFIESTWAFSDRFKIVSKFQNKSSKLIKGFQGTIQISDMFDNKLGEFRVSETFKFYPNQTKTIVGYYSDWIIDGDSEKLKTSDVADLKFTFNPDKIVYSDGTREQF
jgi:hypothetical protein